MIIYLSQSTRITKYLKIIINLRYYNKSTTFISQAIHSYRLIEIFFGIYVFWQILASKITSVEFLTGISHLDIKSGGAT